MTTEKFTNNYADDKFDIDIWDPESYVIKKLKEKGNSPKKADLDVGVSDCKVNWNFTIEMRSWGVKTLSAYATDVELTLSVEWYDKTEEEWFDDEIEVDLTDFEIESERVIDFDGFTGEIFTTQGVQVFFKDKTITVTF